MLALVAKTSMHTLNRKFQKHKFLAACSPLSKKSNKNLAKLLFSQIHKSCDCKIDCLPKRVKTRTAEKV